MKLEDIRFINACTVPWGQMEGTGDRVRHCRICDRNVFNLSALAREEAEAFVDRAEGKECLAFWKRADGTVVSGDCRESALASRVEEVPRPLLGVPAAPPPSHPSRPVPPPPPAKRKALDR